MHAIADTHALIWYLLNDPRLSPAARAAFTGAASQSQHIGIPTISIVEIIYLTEKGRIPQAALGLLQSQLSNQQTVLQIVPLDETISFRVQQINRSTVPEMPDRIIAATALAYNLPLLSRDHKIQATGLPVIW